MSKLKLTATSKLNILLHTIPIIGFAYFAVLSGNTFFGGMTAVLSLLILVDMIACIKARLKTTRD